MSVNVTFSRMVTSGFGLCVVVAVVVVVDVVVVAKVIGS